jgi:hypothetical protein
MEPGPGDRARELAEVLAPVAEVKAEEVNRDRGMGEGVVKGQARALAGDKVKVEGDDKEIVK